MKHTKTGNPLVDSVAEHQAAKPGTYKQYLHIVAKIAPVGFGMVAIGFTNDASSLAASFFRYEMVRLILLTAPVVSVLAGMAIGRVASFCVEGVLGMSLDMWGIFQFVEEDQSSVVECKIVPESNGESKKGKRKKSEDAKKLATASNSDSKSKPSIRSNMIF